MKRLLLRLLSLLVLAAAWEAAGRTHNPHLLPPLSRVAAAWLELALSGELWSALGVSFQALWLGFLLSVLLGIPLGLLMGRYRAVEAFLNLYMTAMLAVPMIAFIPFLVIAFGLGLQSRVWVVFLFAFVIIAVNTAAGVRNVDPNFVEMARSFGARERELFLKVVLPAALPMIMAGLRLGMGRAVLGMVTGEMILAAVGFGAMLMRFGASFDSPSLFATLLTIVVLAVALLGLVQRLDRLLAPWQAVP
ncbi:MAG TPA: ABC transporter permease [candidate division Zixibacteria bacterium]|nr:ABC transporter permease [candidate division Zixibacteria bacterium]